MVTQHHNTGPERGHPKKQDCSETCTIVLRGLQVLIPVPGNAALHGNRVFADGTRETSERRSSWVMGALHPMTVS